MDRLKTVAAINDLSGSSRCSLTVAMPVIAAMGMQCCVLPTAILSNHTGYDNYFFEDYTDNMQKFADNWQKQKLHFDCIYSGFLGSDKQIEIVERFISDFRSDDTKIVIDPVMGDNGRIYTTYTEKMCSKMKQLASHADVITPNITEACTLADMDYPGEFIDEVFADTLAEKISSMGARAVIITGIKNGDSISNYVYSGGRGQMYTSLITPKYYTGTGDLFSSVLCGLVTKDRDVFEAVEFTTRYVHKVTEYSLAMNMHENEGVCFEKFMRELTEV
ncbi:MAG: pyridoxamine kinase [Clostridia bacterium]|nr:pyridoxamine kinase [Clostridia bacterium]